MMAMKVLLCDDSLLVREKLKECLLGLGSMEIIEAVDGQAAVDMYRQYRPNLVFMDIVMPICDGLEALQKIMDMDGKARVIMLSSSGTRTHLKKAIEAGALDFIQKPWEGSQVLTIIKRIQGGMEN